MAKRNMFVGLDVHKESIDVSMAAEGRHGEMRHYGLINGAWQRGTSSCGRNHVPGGSSVRRLRDAVTTRSRNAVSY